MQPTRPAAFYDAGYSFAFSLGNVIGPAIAGIALGAGFDAPFFVTLIIGCGVAAWLSLRLERHLPREINRISAGDQETPVVKVEEAAVVG